MSTTPNTGLGGPRYTGFLLPLIKTALTPAALTGVWVPPPPPGAAPAWVISLSWFALDYQRLSTENPTSLAPPYSQARGDSWSSPCTLGSCSRDRAVLCFSTGFNFFLSELTVILGQSLPLWWGWEAIPNAPRFIPQFFTCPKRSLRNHDSGCSNVSEVSLTAHICGNTCWNFLQLLWKE